MAKNRHVRALPEGFLAWKRSWKGSTLMNGLGNLLHDTDIEIKQVSENKYTLWDDEKDVALEYDFGPFVASYSGSPAFPHKVNNEDAEIFMLFLRSCDIHKVKSGDYVDIRNATGRMSNGDYANVNAQDVLQGNWPTEDPENWESLWIPGVGLE